VMYAQRDVTRVCACIQNRDGMTTIARANARPKRDTHRTCKARVARNVSQARQDRDIVIQGQASLTWDCPDNPTRANTAPFKQDAVHDDP